MYGKPGDMFYAGRVIDHMPVKSVIPWTAMMMVRLTVSIWMLLELLEFRDIVALVCSKKRLRGAFTLEHDDQWPLSEPVTSTITGNIPGTVERLLPCTA